MREFASEVVAPFFSECVVVVSFFFFFFFSLSRRSRYRDVMDGLGRDSSKYVLPLQHDSSDFVEIAVRLFSSFVLPSS
jgi:hypothetical protein